MKSFVLIPAQMMLFVCLVLVATGHATIRNVPSTYPTIQAGVDAAQDGDTVLLAAGTYWGDGNWTVDLTGKSIALIGAGNCIIGGFHIDSLMSRGLGLRLSDLTDSTSLIENIVFDNLGRPADTGAILITNSVVTIRSCRFHQCAAPIVCLGSTRLTLEDCDFYENWNHTVLVGDSTDATPSVSMSGCFLYSNLGAGLLAKRAGLISVANCLFFGCTGHGISLLDADTVSIRHTTIAQCVAHGIEFISTQPAGSQTVPEISETVVYSNGWGGIIDVTMDNDVLIDCTISFDNDSGNFVNVAAADGDPQGNIEADPQFLIPTTWWGLYPIESSPCAPSYNSCGTLLGVNQLVDTLSGCCWGMTGDLNGTGTHSLTDLTVLVNHLFVTFDPIACNAAANTSGDPNCLVNLSDLSRLVDFLFVTSLPVAMCSDFDPNICE